MTKTEAWYLGNIELIAAQMPYADITFDKEEGCRWIQVDPFPLPENVKDDYSKLLIVTPGIYEPIIKKPQGFYLNKGLVHKSGRSLSHMFNKGAAHGAADLSDQGWAWFCLLLGRWKPTYDIVSGDNYATVIHTIFQQLNTL